MKRPCKVVSIYKYAFRSYLGSSKRLMLDPATYPSTQLYQAISDLWQWSLHDPPCLRTHTNAFAEFSEAELISTTRHQTNQPTSPKPTAHVSLEFHKRNVEGTVSLPIPEPENTCLASRPALEDSEETKGAHTQSTHMELWAPAIEPGTSVAFSGCLSIQVISPRPAVPFSLSTLYAPIASTRSVCPKSILSDGSPKE